LRAIIDSIGGNWIHTKIKPNNRPTNGAFTFNGQGTACRSRTS
jgi:hypothetical protein